MKSSLAFLFFLLIIFAMKTISIGLSEEVNKGDHDMISKKDVPLDLLLKIRNGWFVLTPEFDKWVREAETGVIEPTEAVNEVVKTWEAKYGRKLGVARKQWAVIDTGKISFLQVKIFSANLHTPTRGLLPCYTYIVRSDGVSRFMVKS